MHLLYYFVQHATLAMTQSINMLNDSSLFDIEDNGGVAYELANVFEAGVSGTNRNNDILYVNIKRCDSIARASQLQMTQICFASSAISNAAPAITASTMRMSRPALAMLSWNGGTTACPSWHTSSASLLGYFQL
jgi:hypothetical protein